MNKIIIESCVSNYNDSIRAIENGATRLEYCASLDQDGLTPSLIEIENLINEIDIPIRVMIRPSNTFYVNDQEIKIMIKSIYEFSQLPIQGIVFGMLNKHNRVDLNQVEKLISYSNNIPITFHKAIDYSSNILQDVAILNQFSQIDFILSSGGRETAWNGRHTLLDMNQVFNGQIIAAGSITNKNLQKHQNFLNLTAYHGKMIV